jgi:hypothetical protein
VVDVRQDARVADMAGVLRRWRVGGRLRRRHGSGRWWWLGLGFGRGRRGAGGRALVPDVGPGMFVIKRAQTWHARSLKKDKNLHGRVIATLTDHVNLSKP